jgi:hypothetical protein
MSEYIELVKKLDPSWAPQPAGEAKAVSTAPTTEEKRRPSSIKKIIRDEDL